MTGSRILILAVAAFSSACSPPPAKKAAERPGERRVVSVAHVAERRFGGVLEASGSLVAYEEAAIGSELSGYRVVAVLVQEGDVVRKGQALAVLDSAQVEASIAQARGQLAQAEAQAGQARGEAARVRDLDGRGILSDELISARRAQADSADGAVASARAQVRRLASQLSQATIRAPGAGLVLERSVHPGAVTASGGDPLFRIARDQRIELAAEIPEAAMASISEGVGARVTLPSGLQVEGVVRLVSPRIDPATKLGRALIRLPVNSQIREGGYARAVLRSLSRRAPAVPAAALQSGASGSAILIVGPNNRVRSQAVSVGARAGGWIELRQGPPVGTRVTLGGGAFLLDGDAIRPTMPGGAD